MKYFFQSYQAKIMMKKLTMTANSIVFPCIGTGICTCEYIQHQGYLVLEVSVKSGIGAALVAMIFTNGTPVG